MRCKSANHVPSVAVSDETRIPDVSSKAPGDLLHFPSVHAPADGSHEVPEWLQLFDATTTPTCTRTDAHFSRFALHRRHMDNVPEETHKVSVMTHKPLETVAKVRDKKGRTSSPASQLKAKQTDGEGQKILTRIRQ